MNKKFFAFLIFVFLLINCPAYSATTEADDAVIDWGGLEDPLIIEQNHTYKYSILFDKGTEIIGIESNPYSQVSEDVIVNIGISSATTSSGLLSVDVTINTDNRIGNAHWSIVYDYDGEPYHTVPRTINVTRISTGEADDKGVESWGSLTDPLVLEKGQSKKFNIQFNSECLGIDSVMCFPAIDSGDNPISIATNIVETNIGLRLEMEITASENNNGISYYSIVYKDSEGAMCHTILREVQVTEQEIGDSESDDGILSWGELTSPIVISKKTSADQTYEIQLASGVSLEGNGIVWFPSSHVNLKIENKTVNPLGTVVELTISPLSAGNSYYSIIYKDKDGNTCHTSLREIQIVVEEIGDLETDKGISSWGELITPLEISKNGGAKTYEIQFNSECKDIIEGSEVCFPTNHAKIEVKKKGSNILGLIAEVTVTPISVGTSYYTIVYKDTDENICHTVLREIQVSNTEISTQTDKGVENWGGLTASFDIERNSLETYRIQFNSECVSVDSLNYYYVSDSNKNPIEYFRFKDSGSNYMGIWKDLEIAVNDNLGSIYWSISYTDKDGNNCKTVERVINVIRTYGIEETDKGIDSFGELDENPLELDGNKRYVYRLQFNSECLNVINISYAVSTLEDPISSMKFLDTSGDNYIGIWRDVEIVTNENSGSLKWSVTYNDNDGNTCQTSPRTINVTGKSLEYNVISSDEGVESFGGLTDGLEITGKSETVYNFEIQFNEKCVEVRDLIYVASSVENPVSSMKIKSISENSIGLLANVELILSDVSGSISWWVIYEDINGNICRTLPRTITIEHKHVDPGGGGCNSFLLFPALFALVILKFKKS